MPAFLVDEGMPRSTAPALRQDGYFAEDVRDVGLRGHPDQDVFAYAQAHGQILVTADTGFANVVSFPPDTHAGLVVLRVPDELTTSQVNRELLHARSDLIGEELSGLPVSVEVGRTRHHRPARNQI